VFHVEFTCLTGQATRLPTISRSCSRALKNPVKGFNLRNFGGTNRPWQVHSTPSLTDRFSTAPDEPINLSEEEWERKREGTQKAGRAF
ncbi:hypothetical protein ACFL01_03750, partial [Planctomycetota bacterium]